MRTLASIAAALIVTTTIATAQVTSRPGGPATPPPGGSAPPAGGPGTAATRVIEIVMPDAGGAYGAKVTLAPIVRYRDNHEPAPAGFLTLKFPTGNIDLGSYTGATKFATEFVVPSALPAGPTTVPIVWRDKDNVHGANGSFTFTASKAPSALAIEHHAEWDQAMTFDVGNASVPTGAKIELHATLKRTTDNQPVAGREITITRDGQPATKVLTDANGTLKTQLVVPNASSETYHFAFAFAGDTHYLPSSAAIDVPVKGVASSAATVKLMWSAPSIVARAGLPLVLTAHVTKTGSVEPIPNVDVWFALADISLGHVKTNALGIATKTTVPPFAGQAIQYHAHISDSSWTEAPGSTSGDIAIPIAPGDATLIAKLSTPTVKFGQPLTITARLLRADGQPLTNKTLQITPDLGAMKTDSDGNVTWSVKSIGATWGVGPKTIAIAWPGDSDFLAKSAAMQVVVAPADN